MEELWHLHVCGCELKLVLTRNLQQAALAKDVMSESEGIGRLPFEILGRCGLLLTRLTSLFTQHSNYLLEQNKNEQSLQIKIIYLIVC